MSNINLIINSDKSLSEAIGLLRTSYAKHKYLTIKLSTGKPRTVRSNSMSHAWYQQIADELGDCTPLQVKAFCKLHFGVGILKSVDEDYRDAYNQRIKNGFTYEQKLVLMEFYPVTSLFTTEQHRQYEEAMQTYYADIGIILTYPTKD